MGACTVHKVYNGDLTQVEVRTKFEQDQAQARFEDGHSYSGSIGELRGIRWTNLEFASRSEAVTYLSDKGETNGEALAVRFQDHRQLFTRQPTFDGLPPASYEGKICYRVRHVQDARHITMADQLTAPERAKLAKLLAADLAASQQLELCQARLDPLRKQLQQANPLVMTMADLRAKHRAWVKAMHTRDKVRHQLQELNIKLINKLYAVRQVPLGAFWMVGGVARC